MTTFIRRDLLLLKRNTASLISMFIVPALFLLCLLAVFGYSADQSGFAYVDFVLAGCLFQAAMFTAAASAMAVGLDVEAGLIDRIRIFPGATGAYIFGRLVTDGVRIILSTLVLTLTARLCGWDPQWAVAGWMVLWSVVTALVLSLVTDGCVLLARHPVGVASSVQSMEMLLLMLSTAFIPATALSGVLQGVVEHMPFSPVIEVIRAGTPGDSPRQTGLEALGWLVLAAVVGSGLFIRRFTKRSDS